MLKKILIELKFDFHFIFYHKILVQKRLEIKSQFMQNIFVCSKVAKTKDKRNFSAKTICLNQPPVKKKLVYCNISSYLLIN